jgi:hypothetical protein
MTSQSRRLKLHYHQSIVIVSVEWNIKVSFHSHFLESLLACVRIFLDTELKLYRNVAGLRQFPLKIREKHLFTFVVGNVILPILRLMLFIARVVLQYMCNGSRITLHFVQLWQTCFGYCVSLCCSHYCFCYSPSIEQHLLIKGKTNSVALSPRANYTDWTTATY